ncbi:MAG: hypothetical protein V3V85_02770 [Candidatus Thorarchaeota archaeon]
MSNEKVLFLLNRGTGMSPYSHQFMPEEIDPQILSGFISAITSFMDEATGPETTHLQTDDSSDTSFLLEGGDWIIGVLSVSRETNEARSKLRRVVREFEEQFAVLKNADGFEASMFKDFDKFVMDLFLSDRISERTLILKGWDWPKFYRSFDVPSESLGVNKFLNQAEDKQSIKEVAQSQGLTLDEAINFASIAFWKNALYLNYVPSDNDILALSEGSSTILFRKENPLELSPGTVRILGSLDGRRPLSLSLKMLGGKSVDRVLLELGSLANRGYLQNISLERRLVLVNECILSQFFQVCAQAMGAGKATKSLYAAIEAKVEANPWTSRIRLVEGSIGHSAIDVSMTPADLEALSAAIEILTDDLEKELGGVTGQSNAESMLLSVRKHCRESWRPYIGIALF